MKGDRHNQRQAYLVDTTLRDGDQTPGVAFTVKDKVSIAKALDDLGVDVIEAGIPVMSKDEQQAIYEILQLSPKAEILAWNRMLIKDIDASVATGATHIHISVPVSDLHISMKLKSSREQVLMQMSRAIAYATSKDLKVSLGAEDASRADLGYLAQIYLAAQNLGAYRLRYADTVSIHDPFSVCERMQLLTSLVTVPIDFHGHNDFGLGTANALGAFRGGADYISCSINGLGERAGNTALEEIVMVLKYMGDCPPRLHLDKLMTLSKEVERLSGKRNALSKPIVGDEVFTHESGIHVDGLLKEPRTYEYLEPQEVGRVREFVYGKHSGKSYNILMNL